MTVDLIEYVDSPNAELNREGLMAGLAEAGLKVGTDFDVRRHTAQGDIATLSTIAIFLRLRTSSLAEIQLRLAALEEMLADERRAQ